MTFSDETSSTASQKSKLKSLFHWRRPSDPSNKLDLDVVLGRPSPPSSVASSSTETRTRSSAVPKGCQSYTETTASRTSSRRELTRRALHDPPPFAQAGSLATLHSVLEAPAEYTERRYRRRRSTTADDQGPYDLDHVDVEIKRIHKRTASSESTCSIHQVAVFLTTDGYVLQYNAEGLPNRLPERILTINRDSVAFATDAVPGRQWALQISHCTPSDSRRQIQILRPKWSRLALRQSHDARRVETLVLVFDDSEDLYTWMHAVRKEIEQLGGAEYCPDSGDDRSWREDLERAYGAERRPRSDASLSISGQDSKRRTTAAATSVSSTIPPQIRRTSKQSTSSSATTSLSLERIRDSLKSSGNTSTIATGSVAGSFGSASPTLESFPNPSRPTDSCGHGLPLRTSQLSYRRSNLSSPPKSLAERRQLSTWGANTVTDGVTGTRTTQAAEHVLPTLAAFSDANREIFDSTLTGVHTESKSERAARLHNAVKEIDSTVNTKRDSASSGSGEVLKSKYSLFPLQHPSEVRSRPISNPWAPTLSIPSIRASSRAAPVEPTSEVSSDAARLPYRGRSKTTTFEIKNSRVSYLAASSEFDMPQRSPAVTDEMISMNFGATPSKPIASPGVPGRVPNLQDLTLSTDLLRSPPNLERTRAPSPDDKGKSRCLSRASSRSIPNIHNLPPAGPPPSGPLPPVPTDIDPYLSVRRPGRHPHQRRRKTTTTTTMMTTTPTAMATTQPSTLSNQCHAQRKPRDEPDEFAVASISIHPTNLKPDSASISSSILRSIEPPLDDARRSPRSSTSLSRKNSSSKLKLRSLSRPRRKAE